MQLQKEMAGANTTQREGTMRGRREEGRQAGKGTVGQKHRFGTYLEGVAPRVERGEGIC